MTGKRREVCPIILGPQRRRKRKRWSFQFGGNSQRGPRGAVANWRCFFLGRRWKLASLRDGPVRPRWGDRPQ